MKSSVGVTICGVLILIASALALVGTAGAAFMLLGPLKGQLLDPSNLPPGADLNMLRAAMLSGLLMGGAFGAFGVATGIGLIRLWRWARYAAIALSVIVIAFTLLPAVFMAFGPIPPPSSSDPNGPVPFGFRLLLVAFYLPWAVIAGVFIYVLMRKSTVAQFDGNVVERAPRKRPISVTIVAWLMIVGGVMTLPMLGWSNLPAMFAGFVLTGLAAKVFYVTYMLVYAGIGVGLLRNTRAAIVPAVAIHSLGLVNSLLLLAPPVWSRYDAAMKAVSPMFDQQSGGYASQVFGVLFGVAYSAAVVFLLLRAKRSLAAAANQ